MKNNKINNIITTYNKKTWREDGNNIYLGRWSVPFNKEKIISIDIIPKHHWYNKKKRIKDYYYLKKLYQKILKALYISLNKIHNSDYSLKSWTLMLSPWLIYHLTSMFDKHETLKKNIKKNIKYKTQILNYNKQDIVSIDYLDYVYNKSTNDDWHHLIFAEQIKYFYNRQVSVNYIKHFRKKSSYSPLSLKDKIKAKFSANYNLKKNNLFLDTTLLNLEIYFRLSLKTKNIPYFTQNFLAKQKLLKNKINFNLRKILNNDLHFTTSNKFELFLKHNLFDYIPASHLENFKIYEENINNLKFNGKKIISRGAHFSLDFYKQWCARQVENGKKHIISFHGADFPQKDLNFNYEYKIADGLIVHFKKLRKKHVRLPILNLLKAKRNLSPSEILVIIYPESSKFGYRPGLSYVYGESVLESFTFLITALSELNLKILKVLKFRTLYGSTWDFNERITSSFGKKKIDDNKNYTTSLKNKKLVIFNYLGTPFSEAIISNIPSVCLLKKDFCAFEPKLKALLVKMEKNKILFYDSKKFKAHINKNFDTIDRWWNSNGVKSTVKEYERLICFFDNKKYLKTWSSFLNN